MRTTPNDMKKLASLLQNFLKKSESYQIEERDVTDAYIHAITLSALALEDIANTFRVSVNGVDEVDGNLN